MDCTNISLDQLTFETLELQGKFNGANPFDDNFGDFSFGESATDYSGFDEGIEGIHAPKMFSFPKRPGLLYRISQSTYSYCVKAFATPDMDQALKQLLAEDGDNSLDFNFNDPSKGLTYYETKTYEEAINIMEQVGNKRFPIFEDQLFNISDPCSSWRLYTENNRIEILFRSNGFGGESFRNIGPIGSMSIARDIFKESVSIFNTQFPVKEFYITDNKFVLSTNEIPTHCFRSLVELFETGEFHLMRGDFPSSEEGERLYQLLSNLASVRRFWVVIQKFNETFLNTNSLT